MQRWPRRLSSAGRWGGDRSVTVVKSEWLQSNLMSVAHRAEDESAGPVNEDLFYRIKLKLWDR